MKKFTLGAIAGMSSLALAVPLLAQVAGAQTESAGEPASFTLAMPFDDEDRPAPSQACVLAMAAMEDVHLAGFDDMMAQQKSSMQARSTALKAAAEITDDAERKEALKQMREDMVASFKTEGPSDEMQAAMDNMKEACGDEGGFGFGAVRVMKLDGKGPRGGHFKAATFMGVPGDRMHFKRSVEATETEVESNQ